MSPWDIIFGSPVKAPRVSVNVLVASCLCGCAVYEDDLAGKPAGYEWRCPHGLVVRIKDPRKPLTGAAE